MPTTHFPGDSSSSRSSQGNSGGGFGGCAICGDRLSKTNLYIRGLKSDTTDKDLLELCQPYGKIISTKAIIDLETGKCKGYGFVDYESERSAEVALKTLQSNGVQAQMAKQQEQDPTNLYIAGLPSYLTERDLDAMLSRYGRVTSTRILRDNSGVSRGVGFARMDSKDKCEAAIQAFNGKCLPGYKDPLTAKFADGNSKKKLQNGNWIDKQNEAATDLSFCTPFQQIAVTQNGVPQILLMSTSNLPPSSAAIGLPPPPPPPPPPPSHSFTIPISPIHGYYLPTTSAGWIPYAAAGSSYIGHTAPLSPPAVFPTTSFYPEGSAGEPIVFSHLGLQSPNSGQVQVPIQQYLGGPSSAMTYFQLLLPSSSIVQAVKLEDESAQTTAATDRSTASRFSNRS